MFFCNWSKMISLHGLFILNYCFFVRVKSNCNLNWSHESHKIQRTHHSHSHTCVGQIIIGHKIVLDIHIGQNCGYFLLQQAVKCKDVHFFQSDTEKILKTSVFGGPKVDLVLFGFVSQTFQKYLVITGIPKLSIFKIWENLDLILITEKYQIVFTKFFLSGDFQSFLCT